MTGTEQGSADIAGDEAGQQYYLVFPGNVLPGSNYHQSITYLADLLKTSLYKAKKLVSGKKRYIKRKGKSFATATGCAGCKSRTD